MCPVCTYSRYGGATPTVTVLCPSCGRASEPWITAFWVQVGTIAHNFHMAWRTALFFYTLSLALGSILATFSSTLPVFSVQAIFSQDFCACVLTFRALVVFWFLVRLLFVENCPVANVVLRAKSIYKRRPLTRSPILPRQPSLRLTKTAPALSECFLLVVPSQFGSTDPHGWRFVWLKAVVTCAFLIVRVSL